MSEQERGAILLATTNPGKAQRLRWLCTGLRLKPRTLPAGAPLGPDETGQTFLRNAELKAIFWSAELSGMSIASDGGMLVPGLGAAWNPLLTARAAGPGLKDIDRARHLLRLAEHLDGEQRTVIWSEAVAVARDGRILASWEASGTRGRLLDEISPEAMRPGLWAASIFLLPERGATLGSLSDNELEQADRTWSELKHQVQGFFRSGESNLEKRC